MKEDTLDQHQRSEAGGASGGIRRRDFLRGAAIAGAALAAGPQAAAAALRRPATPRAASSAGTRAIAGLKALNLPSDTKITIFAEDLTILGPKSTQAKFEQQSGIKLDPQTAPFLQYADKVFADASTKAGNYDVVF